MKSRRLCHAAFEFGRSARVPAHRSKVNGEPNTNVVKTAENRGSESERERRWEKRFFGRDLKFRGNLAPRAKQTTLSLSLSFHPPYNTITSAITWYNRSNSNLFYFSLNLPSFSYLGLDTCDSGSKILRLRAAGRFGRRSFLRWPILLLRNRRCAILLLRRAVLLLRGAGRAVLLLRCARRAVLLLRCVGRAVLLLRCARRAVLSLR